LALLAGQYVLLQLATGTEYLDAARNMQWGKYTVEQPRFLLGAENVYDRVNGFPVPEAGGTASAGKLSPWWGPAYILLFAGIWRLTGSYTALQIISPLAAGGTVLLTYAFGARFFNRRAALLAAALLALFPTYREHATLALVEPISALLITAALWAFLTRRPYLAVLLGALAMLGKPDMIALYYGTIVLASVVALRDPARPLPRRHLALCLALPLLALVPWLVLYYGIAGSPTTVSGGPRLGMFLFIAPLTVDQLFTMGRPITLVTLGLIGVCVVAALRPRWSAPSWVVWALAAWFALGCLVLLVYIAMPSASNNPRVLIPALPALCLLTAMGLERIGPRLGRPLATCLLVVFVLADIAGVLYQIIQGQTIVSERPLYAALRQQPKGYVLTERYWNVALYADQPVTWFGSAEMDDTYQRTVMGNLKNFQAYIAANPIRYVVLPRSEVVQRDYADTALAGLYERLPFGRELGWNVPNQPAPEVRAFLKQFPQQTAGDFVIFTLDRR
jgi:hypothetical protein